MVVILNNYFGRQFSSLNDVAIHPRNKEMYFTDVTYGFLQDFRPAPVLPNQVYRFNPKTGLVGVVADGFDKPNGMSNLCLACSKLTFRYHLLSRRYLCLYRRYRCAKRPKRSKFHPALYCVSIRTITPKPTSDKQLPVHSQQRRIMGKQADIRICRRRIP